MSTLTKAAAPGRSGSPPSPSKLITGFALPASARIKKRRDFLRAQDRGFRFYTKYFTMYWLRLNVLERPRLGITVSTKVHKRSTRRNRIKRIVREVFRLRLQHLLPEPGDLVVIAKPAVIGCSFQEIEEDLVRSLARLEFSRGRSTASQRSSNRTSQGKHLHNKGMHNKGMHNKGMHRGKASP